MLKNILKIGFNMRKKQIPHDKNIEIIRDLILPKRYGNHQK